MRQQRLGSKGNRTLFPTSDNWAWNETLPNPTANDNAPYAPPHGLTTWPQQAASG
jgi:hypothetical protein